MEECIFEHWKPQSFQGPKAGPGPRLHMAGFPHDSTLQHWQFLILEGIFNFPKKSESFVTETHILSCTCLNYKLKMLKKRCQEKWENAYLTLKNTRASRTLRRALDPGQCMLASLTRRRCAPSASLGKKLLGPPPRPNPGSAPEKHRINSATMYYFYPFWCWY